METHLEQAVETVVRYLDEHGHHELARAVAVATDQEREKRQAAAAEAVLAYRQRGDT